ncbi:MAG: hypothetical protein QM803_05555 [Rhodocyclaceae bacterium]
MPSLIKLQFDPGNGASFYVEHNGTVTRCFVDQSNAFLVKKASPGQSFPAIFERYSDLAVAAAAINIGRKGVSTDPWGNVITAEDFEAAQNAKR